MQGPKAGRGRRLVGKTWVHLKCRVGGELDGAPEKMTEWVLEAKMTQLKPSCLRHVTRQGSSENTADAEKIGGGRRRGRPNRRGTDSVREAVGLGPQEASPAGEDGTPLGGTGHWGQPSLPGAPGPADATAHAARNAHSALPNPSPVQSSLGAGSSAPQISHLSQFGKKLKAYLGPFKS